MKKRLTIARKADVRLMEADTKTKTYMNKREEALKRRLIRLLKEDSRGNRHAKYAERLEDFIVQIVPQPDYTASMEFDTGIIRIGEGLIQDEDSFEQMCMLIRHEMAHALMMHQIRMMNRLKEVYGDEAWEHLKYSSTMHDIENIVADYEISNKRYSEDDKNIARHIWINGQVIKGLVTEDARKAWDTMSISDMYDEWKREADELDAELRRSLQAGNADIKSFSIDTAHPEDAGRFISNSMLGSYIYSDPASPTFEIAEPIEDYIKKNSSRLPDIIKDMLRKLQKKIGDNKDEAEKAKDIASCKQQLLDSRPYQWVDLKTASGDDIARFFTPEEKYLAMSALKYFEGNYIARNDPNEKFDWYQIISGVLGSADYTEDEVKAILDGIKK